MVEVFLWYEQKDKIQASEWPEDAAHVCFTPAVDCVFLTRAGISNILDLNFKLFFYISELRF